MLRMFAVNSGFGNKSQVWGTVGMWAWVIHRITGLGLVLYILIHIFLMALSLLQGQVAFDTAMSILMGKPLFKLVETFLLAAIFYHGLNGIRILLFDMGIGVGVRSQKVIFWVSMAIAATVWVWSIIVKFLI